MTEFDNNWYKYVEFGTTNPLTILLQRNGFSRDSATYIRNQKEEYVGHDADGEKLKSLLLTCRNTSVITEAAILKFNVSGPFKGGGNLMKKIEGSPKNLKQLLQNTKYSIHYYQREYMWQRKHIEELIDDLTSEFMEYYKTGDSRQAVVDYGAYFMGSIVLAGRENAIIDGQQ